MLIVLDGTRIAWIQWWEKPTKPNLDAGSDCVALPSCVNSPLLESGRNGGFYQKNHPSMPAGFGLARIQTAVGFASSNMQTFGLLFRLSSIVSCRILSKLYYCT